MWDEYLKFEENVSVVGLSLWCQRKLIFEDGITYKKFSNFYLNIILSCNVSEYTSLKSSSAYLTQSKQGAAKTKNEQNGDNTIINFLCEYIVKYLI